MSPFFHNFQSKSPAPPPDRRTGRGAIRERLRKAAEPGGVWGVGRAKGKGKGQGQRAKDKGKGQGQRARTKSKDKEQGQRVKDKSKGQGQGLELEMDKVRVGGDWGIGGFWEWWGWEFGWSSYGILIGEMWDGWID